MIQLVGVLVFIACILGAGWEILKFIAGLLGLRGWDMFLAHWIVLFGLIVFFWALFKIIAWIF